MEAIVKSVMGSLTIQLILPGLMLVVLLLLMMYVLFKSQRRADFDLANTLRDDAGKESPWRLCVLGAFAFSSWGLMNETLNGHLTQELWYGYLLTWSGSPALLEFAKRWNGALPFAKGSTTTTTESTTP